jgi:hypothetical protein
MLVKRKVDKMGRVARLTFTADQNCRSQKSVTLKGAPAGGNSTINVSTVVSMTPLTEPLISFNFRATEGTVETKSKTEVSLTRLKQEESPRDRIG